MQRLVNDALSRILHHSLYERMVTFAQQYTPEAIAENVVASWLNRLYLGDPNLYIIVDLQDGFKLVGHAVIDIQDNYGCKILHCYQAQGEKNSVIALTEGAEVIDKIAAEVNADCAIFYVAKRVKVLEDKFGYQSVRTLMMKRYGDINA